MKTWALIGVGLVLVGCGGTETERTTAGPSLGTQSAGGGDSTGVGEAGEVVTSGGSEDGTSGDGPSPAGTEGGVVFDLPAGGDTGMVMGCRNVDFLFVIDNSVSMEDNQAALVGAFPGFMAAIEQTLDPASEFQILITDTDEWGRCNTANPWMGHSPTHSTCNAYIESTVFDECDRVRGAGVDHPAGEYSSNEACTFASGRRYIDSSEPDLVDAFSCAATVGTAGHPSERPMESMVAALEPAINAAGGCNDGFLRDDALLVITFLSDDPHKMDNGQPQDWYDAVVEAKGGDATAVVVLGLTPAWAGCLGTDAQQHWVDFIELWGEQGLHGNICGSAAEYVTFFESAVSTIDEACDNFQPPG